MGLGVAVGLAACEVEIFWRTCDDAVIGWVLPKGHKQIATWQTHCNLLTQDNYHQTLSTQTSHGPTSGPINFLLHVASSYPGHKLRFYLKSNLSLSLKRVSSVGFLIGCEFVMSCVVGSWFGERCSGSQLTYSSPVIFWGLIFGFLGCVYLLTVNRSSQASQVQLS